MATSTYSDTTVAVTKGDWSLIRFRPRAQYRPRRDDPDKKQRQIASMFQRYRTLQFLVVYNSQIDQIAVNGADLIAYAGSSAYNPQIPAGNWKCKDDEIVLHETGSDIYRQTQTWVFIDAWADYDETELD